ncbi:MAG: DUF2382 domain-containing protein [Leptolyngbyaceae cyanobacterium bins.302]|nr:DUF2382 domain-containing protein [Leptolyngbyaceae cyanobacterium bins.302]
MSAFTPNPYESDYSNYQKAPGSFALNRFEVYSDRHERVARVIDGLQNASGELQYLVVEFVEWDPGKQLLIPVHLAQVDLPTQRLYVPSLNRQQVLATPAYNRNPAVNPTPARPVQPDVAPMRSLEQSVPLEASAPLEGYPVSHPPNSPLHPTQPVAAVPSTPVPTSQPPAARSSPPVRPIPPTRPPADLPQAQVIHEEVIPVREERLVVDHKKQKAGEVIVRKEIETEIVEVPVQREKLIVEQVGAEPRQLAEIDLADEASLNHPQRREAQLPPLPDRYE